MLDRDVAANVVTIEKREKEEERQRMMDLTLNGSPHIPHRLLQECNMTEHERCLFLVFVAAASANAVARSASAILIAAATAVSASTASFDVVTSAAGFSAFTDAAAPVSAEADDMILHASD